MALKDELETVDQRLYPAIKEFMDTYAKALGKHGDQTKINETVSKLIMYIDNNGEERECH